MPTTGAAAFVELLASHGVPFLFGNPGTTELPLNDVLVDERGAVHPRPAGNAGHGDGRRLRHGLRPARRGEPARQLRTGQRDGQLYNAHREGTPLLVTAGQQDRRLQFEEPILGGDMVAVARPWTKWSHRSSQRAKSCRNAVRRPSKWPSRRRPGRCSCRCRWTCNSAEPTISTCGPASIDHACVRR